MLLFMMSSSSGDAVHDLDGFMKGGIDGGPVTALTYSGFWFLVDRTGRLAPSFKFSASAAWVGGATGLFISTPFVLSASDGCPVVVEGSMGAVADFDGRPNLGLDTGAAGESL